MTRVHKQFAVGWCQGRRHVLLKMLNQLLDPRTTSEPLHVVGVRLHGKTKVAQLLHLIGKDFVGPFREGLVVSRLEE